MDRKYTAAHEAHVSHTKQHEEIVAKAHKIWDEHVAKEVGCKSSFFISLVQTVDSFPAHVVTFEPDDPNFDLEKVMEYMSKSE